VLAEASTVPVVCHVDHAVTVEECRAGIDAGFSSVMIDGSKLEFAANIEITNRVIEIARKAGVSVEGEIGYVGYSQGAHSAPTSAEEAERFDKETGVDALAISIGNLHLNTEKSAIIDFVVLQKIEAVTRAPLVLHGGSGIPIAIRQKLARETRVKKFNIGTELRMAFGKALRQSLAEQPHEFDRIKLLKPTIKTMQAAASQIIRQLSAPASPSNEI
jgi:fructose-bisphosphate aldolase, class II